MRGAGDSHGENLSAMWNYFDCNRYHVQYVCMTQTTRESGNDARPGLDGNGFTVLGISGRRLAAVLIGWFFVIFDGYDLIVYGTVQSSLMRE